MKKILIAATAVGAAIAGLILYYRRNNQPQSRRITHAAQDAYNTMNDGIGTIERVGLQSMG